MSPVLCRRKDVRGEGGEKLDQRDAPRESKFSRSNQCHSMLVFSIGSLFSFSTSCTYLHYVTFPSPSCVSLFLFK